MSISAGCTTIIIFRNFFYESTSGDLQTTWI
jgi:hypothetical protein